MLTLTELVRTNGRSQTWKYEPFVPKNEQQRQQLLKNKAITDMRAEIKKGADWLSNFNWVLRFTTDPNDPVITSDNPILLHGIAPDLCRAITHQDTLIFFPVCWQMCLIGSRVEQEIKTAEVQPGDLKRLRSIYLEEARLFVVSPTQQQVLS